MRIVSGIYKHRRFEVPKGFKARPTTDFAKENLFNVLANYVDFNDHIRALDLFAGTGSISAELLSRGCERVVCVEKDPVHYAFIRKVMDKLRADNIICVRGDVFKYIHSTKQTFNIIFADPPYALEQLEEIPQLILHNNLLAAGGLFILEHGKTHSFTNHPLFMEQRVYGSVNFSIFRQTL